MVALLKRLRLLGYVRGSIIFKHIRRYLEVFCYPVQRKDVLMRGELLEGASFSLLNLSRRTELLAGLRLPLGVRSLTIGKVLLSGLDSIATGGKFVVSFSDVSLVLFTPGENDDEASAEAAGATPEQLSAARRTLLEIIAHVPWLFSESNGDDDATRDFVEKVLGGSAAFQKGIETIRDGQSSGGVWFS